jgi:hypothetical protein
LSASIECSGLNLKPETTSRFSPKQVVHEQTPKKQTSPAFSAKWVSWQTASYYLIVFRFKKPGNKTSATF